MCRSYFRIEELVPQNTYIRRGKASIELLDARALSMINNVRELAQTTITINNWLWGGIYDQSGLRTYEHYPSKEAYIRSLSQHKYGRGFDCKPEGKTAREVIIELILQHNFDSIYSFIEIDRNWVHVDCRLNRNGESLVLWSPDRGYVTIDKYLNE